MNFLILAFYSYIGIKMTTLSSAPVKDSRETAWKHMGPPLQVQYAHTREREKGEHTAIGAKRHALARQCRASSTTQNRISRYHL